MGAAITLMVVKCIFIFDLIEKFYGPNILMSQLYCRVMGTNGGNLSTADFIGKLHAVNGMANAIVNIGGGTDYSIRQFADMICDATNVQDDV